MKSTLQGFTVVTRGSRNDSCVSIYRSRAGGFVGRMTRRAYGAIGNPSHVRIHVDVDGRRFAITPSDDSDRNALAVSGKTSSISFSSAFRMLGIEPECPLRLDADVRDGALIFTLED